MLGRVELVLDVEPDVPGPAGLVVAGHPGMEQRVPLALLGNEGVARQHELGDAHLLHVSRILDRPDPVSVGREVDLQVLVADRLQRRAPRDAPCAELVGQPPMEIRRVDAVHASLDALEVVALSEHLVGRAV